MPGNGGFDVHELVEPDRVHRSCYTDAAIFDREMDRIFHKAWIYVGHASQVPNPGDFWTTWIGRQRIIMVRGANGAVNVLYNRCPHRGSLLCPERSGNAGKAFRCSYHGWQFHLDGSVRQIPVKKGYENTRMSMDSPDARMKPAQMPYQPSVAALHNNGRLFPPNYLHDSWMDYLYWDSELEP